MSESYDIIQYQTTVLPDLKKAFKLIPEESGTREIRLMSAMSSISCLTIELTMSDTAPELSLLSKLRSQASLGEEGKFGVGCCEGRVDAI